MHPNSRHKLTRKSIKLWPKNSLLRKVCRVMHYSDDAVKGECHSPGIAIGKAACFSYAPSVE